MITIDNLQFGYGHRGKLFSGLHLELKSGQIYGLLGRNGAGKTTLLKLISGLLFPSSGTCEVLGHTPRLREPSLLEQVFFLPEEFDLPNTTMSEYAKVYASFYPNFSMTQLEEYLKKLEVPLGKRLGVMSFGQKKKAYIAFALATNVRLLVMDEPTNGLDIPSKSVFRSLIAEISTEQTTVVISTHQVRDLDSLIDAVVIIEGSDILLNATTSQITDRLNFCRIDPADTELQPLYWEDSIHGRWGVVRNTTGADSRLDMEILFNATVANPAGVRIAFSQSVKQR